MRTDLQVLPEDYKPPTPWKSVCVRFTNRYTDKRTERQPGDMTREEAAWLRDVLNARIQQLDERKRA